MPCTDPHKKFEDSILSLTQYTIDKKGVKLLTASSFTNDTCQLYLEYLHGIQEKREINASTFGSLLHLGLENLDDPLDGIIVEQDVIIENFYRGWNISATIDYIDINDRAIRDSKLTKRYKWKNINQDDSYCWQLRLGAFILKASNNDEKMYENLYVSMFIKDFEATFKDPEMSPLVHYKVEPRSEDEIVSKIKKKIDDLEEVIDEPSMLTQCKDLWWRNKKVNGKNVKVPMRCKKYCSYNHVCPFYKPNENPNTVIGDWV